MSSNFNCNIIKSILQKNDNREFVPQVGTELKICFVVILSIYMFKIYEYLPTNLLVQRAGFYHFIKPLKRKLAYWFPLTNLWSVHSRILSPHKHRWDSTSHQRTRLKVKSSNNRRPSWRRAWPLK